MKRRFLPVVLSIFGFHSVWAAEPPGSAPAGPAEDKEKVEIAIDAPATNYRIAVREIRKVGEELWVLSEVSMAGDIGGAAITTVRDAAMVKKTGLPQKHFVIGKTWGWAEPKTVTYLAAGAEMDDKWKEGEVVFARRRNSDAGAEDNR